MIINFNLIIKKIMVKLKKCPLEWQNIDYKNIELLKKYITKFWKIVPRYYSWISLINQKKLSNAIKKARIMALIPFVKKYDSNYEA